MIVQCPDCTTRYELDARRVPAGRIRVRCARCRYVFPIEAQAGAAGNSPPAPQSRSKPVTPAAADPGIVQDAWASGAARPAADPVAVEHLETVATADNHATVDAEPMMGMESTRIEIEDAPEAAPEMGLDLEIERPTLGRDAETGAQPESPATATMTDAPQPVESDADTASPADQKARRLARALVSDILVYNREKRDTALANGTLVRALGQEIKKSWELYKERVTPEVATSTNYFKEALNDILSEGQQIF